MSFGLPTDFTAFHSMKWWELFVFQLFSLLCILKLAILTAWAEDPNPSHKWLAEAGCTSTDCPMWFISDAEGLIGWRWHPSAASTRLAHSWSFKRYYGGNNFITLHGFFFCRSSTDLWGEEKSSSHSSSLPADLSLISSLLVKAASSQNSLVLMVQIRKSALLGFLWVVLPYVNS